jgi:ornithine cyclodeaminase
MLRQTMLTTFLTRADVIRHLQALHLLRELREAFSGSGPAESPALSFASPTPGSSVVRHGALPGIPAYCVTVRADWPAKDSKSQPGTRAVLQLHDRASGKLLAVMDAAHLTALRAALMGALSVDLFARADATDVAVLGSGSAASGALKALRLVRSLTRVWLYDPDVASSFELAMKLQQTFSMAVTAADSAEEAVADADVVVLTGGVSLPATRLKPGAHVTVLAAEGFTEAPLAPALLAQARLFCELASPLALYGTPEATLAQVLGSPALGRRGPEELTVFASVGPAFLDLVAAWHVLEGARTDDGLTRFDLEA